MNITRMQAPRDMAGFNFKGMPISIDEFGFAEAMGDEMREEMLSHGFIVVPETPEELEEKRKLREQMTAKTRAMNAKRAAELAQEREAATTGAADGAPAGKKTSNAKKGG